MFTVHEVMFTKENQFRSCLFNYSLTYKITSLTTQQLQYRRTLFNTSILNAYFRSLHFSSTKTSLPLNIPLFSHVTAF